MSKLFFENDYVKWQHDAETGALTGAFVKFGSDKNLLKTPAETAILFYDEQTCRPVALKRVRTLDVQHGESWIKSRYLLGGEWLAAQGIADAIEVTHEVRYSQWGIGSHCVTISCQSSVPHLFSLQILSVGLANAFDMLTWRPTLESGVGIWAQNNTPEWKQLYGGRRQSDMQALNAKRLPLSFLILKRGVDGIEFSLGDDLDEWNAYRPADMAPSQEFQFAYDHHLQGYRLFVAPYNLRNDGVLSGTHSFHFQLALPHVKPYMAPLCLGAKIPYGPGEGRTFEERWPQKSELQQMAACGYQLLRVHNDGDSFCNGLFWRDADYPPYPQDEMDKMASCLESIHECGMRATPYFSLKEIHPDVADFSLHSEEWGRRDEHRGDLRYTRYPGGFWGVQMCLKSDWLAKRMDTIREVLEQHPFDGVYFDWCMALECFGKSHCRNWHWDTSEFMNLLVQVHDMMKNGGEMYLHTSNVPSLISENLATVLLTEEVAFSAIGPEMFTPHVHFMNTASRQICNMLPANTTADDLTRLALCALLHHATVADASPAFQKVYRQNRQWMERVTAYKRHHAPGEGWGETDSPNVGMAYYENDSEMMLVFANMSRQTETANWRINESGISGTIVVPGLEIAVRVVKRGDSAMGQTPNA